MSERDLIVQAKRGDDAAFEAIVRPCLDVAFRTAFVITRDADDVGVYSLTFNLIEEGDWEMRSMIRNYAGRPLLQTHPMLVATS